MKLKAGIGCLATIATAAIAQPVQWAGNGHWYEILDVGQVSWTEARLIAESQGAHLATLTSAEESEFVSNIYPSVRRTILGGFQPEPDGPWEWVTGEAWEFTNWHDGEPSNHGGVEDFLYFGNTADQGDSWNDGDDYCGDQCNPPLIAIEWPVCDVDLTGDGVVNTLDFLLFLGAWGQREPLADWDGNGTINTQDFLAYLNDWVQGC